MRTLRYDAAFLLDIRRVEAHLRAHEAADIEARIGDILDALALLMQHPMIGRQAQGEQRELVIGQGNRGYVALYRFDPLDDEVVVLGLRAQRELGFDER